MNVDSGLVGQPEAKAHLTLRKRLEETRVQMGITQKGLAQKLGISAPYLNEIMAGRKSGTRKILEFAKRLDVTVEYLTGEQLLIPLLAEITAAGAFRCDSDQYLDVIDTGPLPGVSKEVALNCYGLRVRGHSMMPFQKHGDVLIVEKESWGRIRPGDKVILKRKLCYIRYVELIDETLILRPLSLSLPIQTEPKATLKNLEKVIYIIPS